MQALSCVVSKDWSSMVPIYLNMAEREATPVCEARKSISQVGDTDTREQLDRICKWVELARVVYETSNQPGLAVVALAKTCCEDGGIKKLRETLATLT